MSAEVTPLGNNAYHPLAEDAAFAAGSNTNANTLYNSQVAKSDSWKTIASRLEVEGMFNVNSTSVTAWRALLGHARNQKVPYIKESGTSWNADLSPKSDYTFSRFSVAGDVEAKSMGSSGAFVEAAEFAGYRILDENMLDALAEEIVNQVRLRGPFLSLSEFVNRQLSSGDLALSGAVQSALDQIAKSAATNPYAVMQAVIPRVSLAVPASANDAEYKFPNAAVGYSTYGLPGWTRQADVLRPLAPILTARDDTFTIRSYGDSRDRNGKITATAVCEAVVCRTRNFVDATDAAELATNPTKTVNQTFGRRFQVVILPLVEPIGDLNRVSFRPESSRPCTAFFACCFFFPLLPPPSRKACPHLPHPVFGAPDNAPEKLQLFDGAGSQEVELPADEPLAGLQASRGAACRQASNGSSRQTGGGQSGRPQGHRRRVRDGFLSARQQRSRQQGRAGETAGHRRGFREVQAGRDALVQPHRQQRRRPGGHRATCHGRELTGHRQVARLEK